MTTLLTLETLFAPLALSGHDDHVTAMGKPVKQRDCHLLGLEDLDSPAKLQVRRHDDRLARIVALAEHSVQKLPAFLIKRRVA